MTDPSSFKFSYPIQIRWKDLDALGHVNNAVFITYFEIARGQYMLEACPGWDWHKHMFLIGNVEANFKKELLLTAKNTQVLMRTSRIGTKSFVLEYAVLSEKDDQRIVHATGSTTQIMFDIQTRKTIEVDEWVRTALKKFEKMS